MGIRSVKTLLPAAALSLCLGLSAIAPARADFSFFDTEGAWVSHIQHQINVLFNGANDVDIGNPVTGHVDGTTTQVDVSTLVGNLEVDHGDGGNATVSPTPAGSTVADFTVSGTLPGTNFDALLFSVSPTAADTTALVTVTGPISSDTHTFTFNNTGENFIGVVASNGQSIHSITIEANGDLQFNDLKHIRVGLVPEPAFYQMSAFLMGGGLLVFRGRRRKQS
jgi:hypothetical protein